MHPKDRRHTHKGAADPLNSTFKQIIYFTDHPSNKKPYIVGYSCGTGFKESKDKIYVLANWIKRMYHKGYLGEWRVNRIEYYRWNNDAQDFSDFILTCYPTQYTFTNDKQLRTNDRFKSWINKLYHHIRTKSVNPEELEIKPVIIYDTQILSLSHRRFESEQALDNFCDLQKRNGIPEDEIHNFYVKYREKFSFSPTSDQLKAIADKFNANR